MALRERNSALHWAATRPEDNTPPVAVAVGHFVQVVFWENDGAMLNGRHDRDDLPAHRRDRRDPLACVSSVGRRLRDAVAATVALT
ncbi:MAG TPA: hypothetical protein VFC35_00060, partial [Gemmatimonadaceae bacterium]|nr:hypothetical protein [Gemmatimonadaceae bacterium]